MDFGFAQSAELKWPNQLVEALQLTKLSEKLVNAASKSLWLSNWHLLHDIIVPVSTPLGKTCLEMI